jgi:tetratricopeptide (TPR) repeat protein
MKKQHLKARRAKVISIDEASLNVSRAADIMGLTFACRSDAEARKLAREALQLDPTSIDAMLLIAQTTRLSPEDYIAKLREAVEIGERTMGAEFIEDNRGRFWILPETRPYMRALFELARAQAGNGDVLESIEVLEQILALDPADHQSVRDYLLALYLAVEHLHGAERLITTYGRESGAVFAWGAVFFHVLKGARAKAEKALHKALDRNAWALMYFGGRKPHLCEMYEPGSEEEGEHIALVLAPAWIAHPDIVVWIAKSVEALVEP